MLSVRRGNTKSPLGGKCQLCAYDAYDHNSASEFLRASSDVPASGRPPNGSRQQNLNKRLLMFAELTATQ